MSDSTNEINLLVHRYLEESGYAHSAYLFSQEAKLELYNLDDTNVPPAALISILQKGVQYVKAERTAADIGSERTTGKLSLLEAALETKKTDSVVRRVLKYICSAIGISNSQDQQTAVTCSSTRVFLPPPSVWSGDLISTVVSLEVTNATVPALPNTDSQQNDRPGDNESEYKISSSRANTLYRKQLVFGICAWNPRHDILASYSKDFIVRIWNVNNPSQKAKLSYGTVQNGVFVPSLSHVSSLDWSSDGSLLAAGCYDGFASIWTTNGGLVSTLKKHEGSFMDLKWNMSGTYLLSADTDRTATVWDMSTGTVRQKFSISKYDSWLIDWKSDNSFATSFSDHNIYVYELGLARPVIIMKGHTEEVHCIKWCPSGRLLTSCSDDMSVKVWSLEQDTPLHNFQDHTDIINAIDWSNTANPNFLLASGSYDSTVRLWDVERGSCIHPPMQHYDDDEPVRTVAFSPDGRYLASGGNDNRVRIWSTQSGQLVNWYQASGAVLKVSWNASSDKIGVSTDDGSVIVLDMRM